MNEQLSTLRRQQDCQDKSSEHGHRMCKASKEQTTRETNHKMTTLEGASTQEMQCNLYEMTTRETNHKMNQHPAWYQSPAWAPSIFGDCPFGRRVVARSLADFERKGVDTEAGILSGISRKRSVRSSPYWLTESCNSQCLSHFAAPFIIARAETSITESCKKKVGNHFRK